MVKVAIIGGGVSGLSSIKCCLDAGLQPTCFEQQSWLGGVWKYSDEVLPDIPSVHNSTVTNTSKSLTCFSDFPMPKDFPNYLSHRLLQEYLEMYATHFGLKQYIQFNTTVVRLSRSEDHKETGRWVVSYRKLKVTSPNDIVEETFDAVMVCNGHFWDQAKPKFSGLERFKGVQVHSGDYRTFHPYIGKRVVVVGCGNSAGDVACELSHHASQVYISTRSGCYIFQRPGAKGMPIDLQTTRANIYLPVPLEVKQRLVSGFISANYDLANFGLQPTGSLWVTQFPIVNDALPHQIITGSIMVKSDIKEVTETAVVFNGGDVVDNIDAIIFCTGFKLNFPFAKEIVCVKDDCYASLYKHVFLPDSHKGTLAVIGVVGVDGTLLPVFEMQARVAAEVFAGRCTLPNEIDMMKEVEQRECRLKRIGLSKEKFSRVGFIPYLDELAVMIGAKPNLWSLFMEDPKLALQCFFGPCVPAQYRLHGPNPFKDARMVIRSVKENYLYPFRTRKCPTSKPKRDSYMYFFFFSGFCVSVVFILFLTWL